MDQITRAKSVADAIKKKIDQVKESIDVHLLDCHGRMLVLIILALRDINITLGWVNFTVIDFNKTVFDFHKTLFPTKIHNQFGNVLDFKLKPKKNSVVYLNFCSIPSSVPTNVNNHFKNQTEELDPIFFEGINYFVY
jgi:hypothetical protein